MVGGIIVFAVYIGLDLLVGFLVFSSSSAAEKRGQQKVYGV